MNLRLSESADWRQYATVEVADRAHDFRQLVRDESLRFRADRAEQSPTGYRWYDIYIDVSMGERRAARAAWSILTALRQSAQDGLLEDFRILSGEHWLTFPDHIDDEEQQASIGAVAAHT